MMLKPSSRAKGVQHSQSAPAIHGGKGKERGRRLPRMRRSQSDMKRNGHDKSPLRPGERVEKARHRETPVPDASA